MCYGDHVNRVGDIGSGLELDTALEDADEEVIRVGCAVLWVSQNISRADDAATQALLSSLSCDVFGRPLGLAIASTQTLACTL